MVAAHSLVSMLVTLAQLSLSTALSMAVVVVVVVVADAVGLTRVVILLKRVGGGGIVSRVVGSFANIFAGGNTPQGTMCARSQRSPLRVTARHRC